MSDILNMIYVWMTENSITWTFNNLTVTLTWWSIFIGIAVISLAIMIIEKILN